ncbi:predicted protein [Nematostella vectensis]|uniref:Uncharacterized protein n=2 Tax=Nematostella vectensis TaxID=45351 RepID=A7S8H6_NEMVE|nr:predicted protein [Nematostella vectensis]|eukprot:XP_001632005.1 predicted protein [Nematostella vectensis]
MEKQKELTISMRAILVDWLVEVQESFELYHETLYLGVRVLDNYLMRSYVERENLQLVGAVSLYIACKVEERHPPCLDDFLYICDDAYQQKAFVAMEKKILNSLEFNINMPIPYRFLRRFAKVASADVKTLTLSRFILETTLHHYKFIVHKPSFLAAACLRLALRMKGCDDWTPTVVHYTGYSVAQLDGCVIELNEMISEPPKQNLMTVRNKYSHKVFHEVALIPPLDSLNL